MKFLFLIAPSEGKNPGGKTSCEELSYIYDKPDEIVIRASMKDLKCKGLRYAEAKALNDSVTCGPFMVGVERYSGIMYKAIDYNNMTESGRKYFDEHIVILSGMYGLVRPRDSIANYKLPVECRGITAYWKKILTATLSDIQDYTHIVNLLPMSYQKMIDFSGLKIPVIHIEFEEEIEICKNTLTHNIKKIRGEFIRRICEQTVDEIQHFPGIHLTQSNNTHITLIPSKEGYFR